MIDPRVARGTVASGCVVRRACGEWTDREGRRLVESGCGRKGSVVCGCVDCRPLRVPQAPANFAGIRPCQLSVLREQRVGGRKGCLFGGVWVPTPRAAVCLQFDSLTQDSTSSHRPGSGKRLSRVRVRHARRVHLPHAAALAGQAGPRPPTFQQEQEDAEWDGNAMGVMAWRPGCCT